MKRRRIKKGYKRSQKKSRRGKVLLFLIPIGITLSVIYLFRQEISDSLKPRLGKRSIVTEKKAVTLYFSDQEEEYLIGEKREILKTGEVEEEMKALIVELTKGPKGRLIPTLPPRTKLLTFHVDQGKVARVNFNKALIRDHPGGSSAELMTIYSIVNSLALNFPQIKRVQILVEGKEIETIAGHLSLKNPISPKPDLIKRLGKNQRGDV